MNAAILAGAAAILLLAARGKKKTMDRWKKKSSAVLLSAETEALITRILERAGVSGAVITSGRRTWSQQAGLMITETDEALYDLYNDKIIDALLSVERTQTAWAEKIEELAGKGWITSRHTLNPEQAFDLRTGTDTTREGYLTPSQQAAIKTAAEAEGIEVIDEGDHLHFEW